MSQRALTSFSLHRRGMGFDPRFCIQSGHLHANPGRSGFTLVELLIVIAIIAVLMSILFPVLHRVRQQTLRVACAGNMHQWAIALQSYAVNNKGSFPFDLDGEDASWIGATMQQFATEYIGQDLNGLLTDKIPNGEGDHVMYCPTQQWHRYVRDNWAGAPLTLATNAPAYNNSGPGEQELVGYFYLPYRNADPAGPNGANNYSVAGNAWVAKKKFYANDAPNAPILTDMLQTSNFNWGGVVPYSSHCEGSTNIPAGGNFMFEDGHVEWHNLAETDVGDIEPGSEYHYKITIAQ